MRKIRVGILFGGKSCEHEISLLSAKSVIDALDQDKYEPVLISIDKTGVWHVRDALNYLLNTENPKQIRLQGEQGNVAIIPIDEGDALVNTSTAASAAVDVIFPVLHGTYGEDGTVQGLLKMAGIPFVGADVLGSAIGMDKDVAKRLLKESGIPIGKFIVVRNFEREKKSYEYFVKELGLPFFIKPANAGSSVGVSKIKTEEDFQKGMSDAFLYDRKIIVEEFISGREIECSVLGNDHPIASLPGEVIPEHEFYSYEAKYLDENGARFEIPALLPEDIIKNIQEMAIQTFKVLCCEGMARVDFFLTKKGELFVNEINTIPGFTKISMYPKLWQVSGVPYKSLLDNLINLALERRNREIEIQTVYKIT